MKTKNEIMEEMKKDVYWKDYFDMDSYGIEKIQKEINRRLNIQKFAEERSYEKKSNELYFSMHYLQEKKKELLNHYNENIHGKENWNSFEKSESIEYVLKLLGYLSEKINENHIDVQKIVNDQIEFELNLRCPECDSIVFYVGDMYGQAEFECINQHKFNYGLGRNLFENV